jgi:hypothetical protein
MAKKEEKTGARSSAMPGSRSTKKAKTIWLSPDVVRRLKKASEAEGMSQSIYVEQTLRARFKKDGVE